MESNENTVCALCNIDTPKHYIVDNTCCENRYCTKCYTNNVSKCILNCPFCSKCVISKKHLLFKHKTITIFDDDYIENLYKAKNYYYEKCCLLYQKLTYKYGNLQYKSVTLITLMDRIESLLRKMQEYKIDDQIMLDHKSLIKPLHLINRQINNLFLDIDNMLQESSKIEEGYITLF